MKEVSISLQLWDLIFMELSNAEYFMRLIDKYCLSQIFVFLWTVQHKDQQPSHYESHFAGLPGCESFHKFVTWEAVSQVAE